jgi:hypothetical protein
VEADAGQRIEGLAQRIVEDALHVHGAQCNGTALLLDIPQLLAEEDQAAVLLSERHMHVAQHFFDGFLYRVELRWRRDGGMHQADDVLHRHRQVAQDLQHCNGLRDVLMELRIRKANLDLANRLVDGREGTADVLLQLVVERDGGGKPTHGLIGHRLGAAFTLQDVLDHLDRRAQADAAGGLGQGAEQVQQDVEVSRQERVEIGETLFAEVRVVILGVLQLGVVPQGLTMGIEQLAELGLAQPVICRAGGDSRSP